MLGFLHLQHLETMESGGKGKGEEVEEVVKEVEGKEDVCWWTILHFLSVRKVGGGGEVSVGSPACRVFWRDNDDSEML